MLTDLHATVADWYTAHARDLPWRRPGTTPWGVLVSEVMSQQTPVARVAPAWEAWMGRWPEPADLAAAAPADVLRAWDRLGYPRRALRLRECAEQLVARFDGAVPRTEEELLSLPGVGAYTAAAVVSFAHGGRALVLDTNVRRVLGRVVAGRALPPPGLTAGERVGAADLLPADAATSVRWNEGVMELGALVCTARAPRCTACPLVERCRWRRAGAPPATHARRRQAWHGTDRQARGRVMARLRELPDGRTLGTEELLAPLREGAADVAQPDRALASLLADGLVTEPSPGRWTLPG
ncbi:A/G-specific DNA-adenine glycosylase [Georgenia satyanarayanai]|uniref:Adenine DNA glycosylase n=1 Tax=Georgenia satyanarayanai TaxID=860221 RepID=A0A2Y9AEP3_9MICO|nr:A/G-specific adenine glycosylase [Georgenia satyanarayanai]PYF99551.1 A/G-specific DNA-adenine glycosylase [Georgenia satyanarayanai]SSA42396.1 A/G-specific DNA-adenine glycosylase [Georgenia satyanarayanai]